MRLEQTFCNSPLKVLVCYREPVDAPGCLTNHRMMRGTDDPDRVPGEIIDDNWEALITPRFYDIHLQRLLQHLPHRAIHVMNFERMDTDCDDFFQRLYECLGVAYSNVHRSVTAVNASRRYRPPEMQGVLFAALSTTMSEAQARQVLRCRAKDQPWRLRLLQRLNTRRYVESDPQLNGELQDLFGPHMHTLERILANLSCIARSQEQG